MKLKALTAAALAIFAAQVFAASPAATQEWVRRYIATNGVVQSETIYTENINTNTGVITLTYSNSMEVVTMTSFIRDKLALMATNCDERAVALGITNGTLFAWCGDGIFTNAFIQGVDLHGRSYGAIGCQSTNRLEWAGAASHIIDGKDTFTGDAVFSVVGTKIDRPTSRYYITGSTNEVSTAAVSAPCDPWYERALAFIGKLLVPTACADTWENLGAAWYTPEEDSYETGNYNWAIEDDKGNVSVLKLDENNYPTNLNEVMEELRLSVKSVFKTLVDLAASVASNCDRLNKIDAEFEMLASKLDTYMAQILARLDGVEDEVITPTSGGSTASSRQRPISGFSSSDYKSRGNLKLGGEPQVVALWPDSKSILAKNGQYGLIDIDNQSKYGCVAYNANGYLGWSNAAKWFSSAFSVSTGQYGIVANGGINITNFNNNAHCDEKLSTMLSVPGDNQRAKHAILTRYRDGNSASELHWLPVGDALELGVNAITNVDTVSDWGEAPNFRVIATVKKQWPDGSPSWVQLSGESSPENIWNNGNYGDKAGTISTNTFWSLTNTLEFVRRSGDTMTGPLFIDNREGLTVRYGNDAKAYLDSDGLFVKSGGSVTIGSRSSEWDIAIKNDDNGGYIEFADTESGNRQLRGPFDAGHALTDGGLHLKYRPETNDVVSVYDGEDFVMDVGMKQGSGYVLRSGDTMAGALVNESSITINGTGTALNVPNGNASVGGSFTATGAVEGRGTMTVKNPSNTNCGIKLDAGTSTSGSIVFMTSPWPSDHKTVSAPSYSGAILTDGGLHLRLISGAVHVYNGTTDLGTLTLTPPSP